MTPNLKIPEVIKLGMRFKPIDPSPGSLKFLDITKIDGKKLWATTDYGVTLREPTSREELIAFDYELVEEEDNTI